MSKTHKPDYILLGVIFILILIGMFALASANSDIKHQFLFGILPGIAGLFVSQKVNYKFWQKIALPFFIVSLGLVGLIFVSKFGFGYGGAIRWIQLGPIAFQPGEIVKLSFIIFLSSLFAKQAKLMPFLTWTGVVSVFFILQPDIGTLGLILIIALIIYFTAGAKLWQIALCALGALAGFLVLIKLKAYRLNRLLAFIFPNLDPQGIGYQINQALIAFGSGGWFGKGLGQSQQRAFLPALSTDSIFAILGEEIGFIGIVFILILFLIFALRSIRIAIKAPDQFSRLLAIGICSWLILQALINIMAITGLMPLTGIPLPFISYGASAMIACLIASGILLNISKYT